MAAKMTEYERRRLENIKRNEEMLAALKIQSKLSDLSAAAKHQRVQSKSYKRSPVKKPKTESPVVLRRSLRTRGVAPDAATAGGLSDDLDDEKRIKKTPRLDSSAVDRKSPKEEGPIPTRDAYRGDDGLEKRLFEIISGCCRKSELNEGGTENGDGLVKSEVECETFGVRKRSQGSVDVGALRLKGGNVARVVPGRIMTVRFFPSVDMQMVVVGNKFGDIGFWNTNGEEDGDGDGFYLFNAHSGPVSGILIDPFSVSKMYSSCYDGFIRLMNVEKEVFDMVYHGDHSIWSISMSPRDMNSLYFGESKGLVSICDVRAGKSAVSFDLHEDRINTIDFNSENENIMATSSTDGTVSIWDLRYMNADEPTSLKTVRHKRAVHSAYFSPSGKFLATTSLDDRVGLVSGANYENTSMIYHFNQTGRWISTFRGIWGWDDSSIYIGNVKRGVDVISVAGKRNVATLESENMSAIPCRFDAHPYNVGMLAGATSGGQVYIWTSS